MNIDNDFLSKLKAKVYSGLNYPPDPPSIIDMSFLSGDEILYIKSKVFSLKTHWKCKNLNDDKDTPIPTRMLPLGMYSRQYDEYIKEVDTYKSTMYENFHDVYNKILQKLSEHFKCSLSYVDKAHYPGFHIFSLNDNFTIGDYPYINFHRDGFGFLKKMFDYQKIYSCVIPIELPKNHGSLLYTLSEVSLKGRTLGNFNYDRIQYNKGQLLVWPSNLWHSIEPFKLSYGESRITLQMHIAIKNNEGVIFW